jgi:capsular polysaccharide biosynthesis protein
LAQKSLYIVIGLIAALVVLSILNLFGALDHFSTSSEQVDKIVDLTLLAVLIVILMPLVFTITKVKKCPG